MSHECNECLRDCECWDGENLGEEFCTHAETPACDVRDDLRDDLEFDSDRDDAVDWYLDE